MFVGFVGLLGYSMVMEREKCEKEAQREIRDPTMLTNRNTVRYIKAHGPQFGGQGQPPFFFCFEKKKKKANPLFCLQVDICISLFI